MLSLLHISDLHRTSGPRVRNAELLAAIASDSQRWTLEGIRRPDLIVVSGDIVQGAGADDPDSDEIISGQYAEANDFLLGLAAEFVDADRSRVVLVPGNHDVGWKRSRDSMMPVTPCPPDIAQSAIQPDSGVRWDWSVQRAFRIHDTDKYESRFEQFRRFQSTFYSGLDPSPLAIGQDLIFCNYEDLGVVIVGFPSWHGNDCFCDVGEIEMAKLAAAREALKDSKAPIAMAVWHHSLRGGPRFRDYMDERAIHRMIDFGFSLGLHGHQHFPGASPYEIHLPNKTSMVVVSAGSLAVGDADLPMGERREFNIVVVDPKSETVSVHVRGMSKEGVFSGAHRDDFGGNTYIDLPLQPSPARPAPPSTAERLDRAMTFIKVGEFENALDLAATIDHSHERQRRQIEAEALAGLGLTDQLVDLLSPPQAEDEAVRLVSVLMENDRLDDAEKAIGESAQVLSEGLTQDLTELVQAKRMMP